MMKTIKTTLATEAIYSEDGTKRYLLRKIWDGKKPMLAIVMLAPGSASGVELDTTTQLVLNNASRLGFGGVEITNLFAALNDPALKQAETEDSENLKAILGSAEEADTVVFAPGLGKAKNQAFNRRQEQVLNALRPFEPKLHCLTNPEKHARFQHPLSPAVREWVLAPLKVEELLAKREKPRAEKPRISKPSQKTDEQAQVEAKEAKSKKPKADYPRIGDSCSKQGSQTSTEAKPQPAEKQTFRAGQAEMPQFSAKQAKQEFKAKERAKNEYKEEQRDRTNMEFKEIVQELKETVSTTAK